MLDINFIDRAAKSPPLINVMRFHTQRLFHTVQIRTSQICFLCTISTPDLHILFDVNRQSRLMRNRKKQGNRFTLSVYISGRKNTPSRKIKVFSLKRAYQCILHVPHVLIVSCRVTSEIQRDYYNWSWDSILCSKDEEKATIA